jgi:cytosine/creatinine deaminase
MSSSGDLLLVNGRLADGRAVDVLIRGGTVAGVAGSGSAPTAPHDATDIIDLSGALLLPALVDGHAHLDKTLWGMPWRPHTAGAQRDDRIESEKRERSGLRPVEERGGALLRTMIAQGTTAVRTHVDIDLEANLDGLHAVLRLREQFSDLIDIQIVAFPQSGVVRSPGVADLLDQALADGADLIGGIDPQGYDRFGASQLDVVFGLAAKHGKGIDIHLHDIGAEGLLEMADIVERAQEWGKRDRVTVSHAFCLGEMGEGDFGYIVEGMAAAGVSIATHAPGSSPMPPVKALRGAGINIFAGSDNIRDRWGPFGNGSMLERAMLVAWRQGYRTDPDLALAYDLCSAAGRDALGLPSAGPEAGLQADLIALPATTIGEAVVSRPLPSLVLKRGRVVARDGQVTA